MSAWTALCLILALGVATTSVAQTRSRSRDIGKPLYEVGVGGGGFFTPDYPGAEQGKVRYLGAPYLIYRGRVLRADEDSGLRGRFLSTDRVEIDLSAAAAFPANSEDNRAREGMPDLDWIGEIGPRLIVHLWESDNAEVDFNLPFHFIFSTNFRRFSGRGFLTQPNVFYRHRNWLWDGFNFYFGAGIIFATESLTDYFYEVSPEHATPDRPAYEAEPGFIGSKLLFGASQKFSDNFWIFLGLQNHFYDGATNEASPLMKDRVTTSWGLGFAWKFYESDERAEQWL